MAFLLAGIGSLRAEEELRFDIADWRVEGNSVLPQTTLDAVLVARRGPRRTLNDVLQAVQALQEAYVAAGYAAVQVALPEQDTSAGIIRLQVVEPRIARIAVENSDGAPATPELAARVERALPALRARTTPDVRAIDDDVRFANEYPARRLQVGLEPDGTGTDLLARVKTETSDPLRIFVRADNTGTAQTGRTRASIGFQRADLFDADHVASAQFTTSPERIRQTQSVSASYRVPFHQRRLLLDLVAAWSDTEAAATSTPAGDLNFAGKGGIWSARLTRPLPTRGGWEHRIAGGLDYKAFTNICSLGSFGSAGCGTAGANITVHPWNLHYSGKTGGENWQFSAGAGYARNIPGGTNGDAAAFAAARAGATDGYQVIRANTELAAALPGEWLKGWQGRAALNAQESPDALVSAEQFGLGGAGSVRGYGERAQGNDRGWQLTLEAYGPGVGGWFGLPAEALRGLLFHDSGATRRNQAQPGEAGATRLASVGGGLRLVLGKQFQAQLDLGRAQVHQAPVRAGDWHAHGSVMLTW